MFIEYEEPSAAASAIQGGWMLNGKNLSTIYAEFDIYFPFFSILVKEVTFYFLYQN